MILDTNALSAFLDGDPSVRQKLANASGPYLPVLVLGEFHYGLLSSRDRERRLTWCQGLIQHWTVLEISTETASAYANIRHTLKTRGTPIPANDIWISALARQHNLPLLSADAHFDLVPGIRRIQW